MFVRLDPSRESLPMYRTMLEDIMGDGYDQPEFSEAEVVAHTMLPQAAFDRLYEHLSTRTGGLLTNQYHLLDQSEDYDLEQWGLGDRKPGIYIANGVVIIAFAFSDGSESDAIDARGQNGFWAMLYVSRERVEKMVHDTLVSFNPA